MSRAMDPVAAMPHEEVALKHPLSSLYDDSPFHTNTQFFAVRCQQVRDSPNLGFKCGKDISTTRLLSIFAQSLSILLRHDVTY